MKCQHRRYKDATIDTALRAMRLRGVAPGWVLNKQRCYECRGWKVVRDRVAAPRTTVRSVSGQSSRTELTPRLF